MIDRVRDDSVFIYYFYGFVCIPYSHSCCCCAIDTPPPHPPPPWPQGLEIGSCSLVFSSSQEPQWSVGFTPPPPCCGFIPHPPPITLAFLTALTFRASEEETGESGGHPHILAWVTPQNLSYLGLNITSFLGFAPLSHSVFCCKPHFWIVLTPVIDCVLNFPQLLIVKHSNHSALLKEFCST